ncbi:hypothetical protein NDU88_004578, partial [Pleurodeles waltl]
MVVSDLDHYPQETVGEMEARVPKRQAEFDRILAAIADTKAALQQDIRVVSMGLGLLLAEHHKWANRVKEVESGLEEIEPSQMDLKRQVGKLVDRLQTLELSAEDAEGRNYQNNVRVVGLLEGSEQDDMVAYLEK